MNLNRFKPGDLAYHKADSPWFTKPLFVHARGIYTDINGFEEEMLLLTALQSYGYNAPASDFLTEDERVSFIESKCKEKKLAHLAS